MAMQRIAARAADGAERRPAGVFDLAARHGAPTSLAAIGMRAADLDRAADSPCRARTRTRARSSARAIRELLQRAFDGVRPD